MKPGSPSNGVAERTLDWRECTPDLPLGKGEIHLWLVNVEDLNEAHFTDLPDDRDRERSERIIAADKRALYLGGRTGLRLLASWYSGIAHNELEFGYGTRGKPRLPAQCNSGELKFNYTVSGVHAFYAFAWNIELGVDLEMFPRDIMADAMSERILSDAEKSSWNGIEEADRNNAMLRCWTRKEAYGKLLGAGIRYNMNKATLFDQLDRDSWVADTGGLFQGEYYPGSDILHGIQLALPVEGAASIMYECQGSVSDPVLKAMKLLI